MKTFMVLAYDADDEGCSARREASRVPHFDSIAPFLESGQIIAGGGLLDESDGLIGSVFFAKFETKEALEDFLSRDPLTVNGVWEKIEITPMKLVINDSKIII